MGVADTSSAVDRLDELEAHVSSNGMTKTFGTSTGGVETPRLAPMLPGVPALADGLGQAGSRYRKLGGDGAQASRGWASNHSPPGERTDNRYVTRRRPVTTVQIGSNGRRSYISVDSARMGNLTLLWRVYPSANVVTDVPALNMGDHHPGRS